MEIKREIHQRMLSSDEFEFASLHMGLPTEAYRMADRILQDFRKRGFATYRRVGRKFIWWLTPAGREALKAGA